MDELPAESRITSRVEGETLVITIPNAGRGMRAGCLRGSWAGAAVCAFLAVSCAAQGIFSGNLLWTGVGLAFFVIAGGQLLLLRGAGVGGMGTVLEIAPEFLAMTLGASGGHGRLQWMRSEVTGVSVESRQAEGPAALRLQLGEKPGAWVLKGVDTEELRWIAGQIRNKWGG